MLHKAPQKHDRAVAVQNEMRAITLNLTHLSVYNSYLDLSMRLQLPVGRQGRSSQTMYRRILGDACGLDGAAGVVMLLTGGAAHSSMMDTKTASTGVSRPKDSA
ncbi:hypothetical protein Q7P37_002885 [Cladosporium fusiforme]